MSKEAPEVKPLPGVMRVPQSSNWQYWKRNPDTLKDHPALAGRQWAFRASLGTPDLREANRLAAAKLSELESYWSTLRAGTKPTAVLDVTPAMMEAIAQRLHASVLAEDEALRRAPLALAKSLAYWWQAHEKARQMAHERTQREAMKAEDDTPFRPGKMPKWLSDEDQEELQAYVKAGQVGVPLGGLLELLQERHQGAGDVLLIEQVDRLSRLNAQDWEALKRMLSEKHIRVVALDLPTSWMGAAANLDETTQGLIDAVNRMLLDMLAVVARKDYTDRRRRQAQGIEKAKTAGLYRGRQPDAERHALIGELLDKGLSWSQVCTATKASRSTVKRVVDARKAA